MCLAFFVSSEEAREREGKKVSGEEGGPYSHRFTSEIPHSALSSGWNCVARMDPFSMAAKKGIPWCA